MNVLIVDSDPGNSPDFRRIVSRLPEFVLMGQVRSWEELLAARAQAPLEMVIVNMRREKEDSHALVRRLLVLESQVRIILFTASTNLRFIGAILQFIPEGFIDAYTSESGVVECLYIARSGATMYHKLGSDALRVRRRSGMIELLAKTAASLRYTGVGLFSKVCDWEEKQMGKRRRVLSLRVKLREVFTLRRICKKLEWSVT